MSFSTQQPSSGSLIGGSALGGSIAAIEKESKALLQISFDSIEQSTLSNQAAIGEAINEFTAATDAAWSSYDANMDQAKQEFTSAGITGFSAGASLAFIGFGGSITGMKAATADEASAKAHLDALNNANGKEPNLPGVKNLNAARLGTDPADVAAIKKADIRNDVVHNNGKLSQTTQGKYGLSEHGVKNGTQDVDPDFATSAKQAKFMKDDALRQQGIKDNDLDAKSAQSQINAKNNIIKTGQSQNSTDSDVEIGEYDFKQEKIQAIQKDLANEGRISQATIDKYGTASKGWLYGSNPKTINPTEDEEAQYAFKQTREELGAKELQDMRTTMEGHITQASNHYNAAQNQFTQYLSMIREISSSIDTGVRGMWDQWKARSQRDADMSNANSRLYGTISQQMFSLKDSWTSLQASMFNQSTDLLNSTLGALRMASSAA